MGCVCRQRVCRLALVLVCLVWANLRVATARAQFGPTPQFQLSQSVHLDEADTGVRRHLEQVQTFVDAAQWDEAIETLRRIAADHGERMVKFDERRYLNVRDFCQLQFCRLPAEALALYRARVDAQARQWFEQGRDARDEALLRRTVDQFFASSWGDDALDALAEIWLEAGDYSAARAAWRRLLPEADGQAPQDSSQPDVARPAIAYPDSDLAPARILARLALVSLLEEDRPRAEREIAELARLFPSATGRLGGREVSYVEALGGQLANSENWPAPAIDEEWLTFGGSPERTRPMAPLVDVGAREWYRQLPKVPGDPTPSLARGFASRRLESSDELLSYHPIVVQDSKVGNIVLVNDASSIWAFDLATGEPRWESGGAQNAGQHALGRIYYDDSEDARTDHQHLRFLGAPRFTMTAHGSKLFARMGSSITAVAPDMAGSSSPGYLVCLDLAAEGRQVWREAPRDDKWAFEGAPLCDGRNVYVAMRRSDVRPQAHVVCLDAETGRERWRRFICAAETPARGQINECTHNLLTLHRDRLYVNTNLGAIAALACEDGRIDWITLYDRAQSGDLNAKAAHFYRDLNPCIYHRGRLFVAPADCEGIVALDADSGQVLWESPFADSALHLLGVGAGNLIASGDHVWWIDVESGKLVGDVPVADAYGRGALMGDRVYIPNRVSIDVYEQSAPTRVDHHELWDKTTKAKAAAAVGPGSTGGNLLSAGGRLLIATGDHLLVFSQFSQPQAKQPDKVVDSTAPTGRSDRADDAESAPSHDGLVRAFYRELVLRTGRNAAGDSAAEHGAADVDAADLNPYRRDAWARLLQGPAM